VKLVIACDPRNNSMVCIFLLLVSHSQTLYMHKKTVREAGCEKKQRNQYADFFLTLHTYVY
jgi:hypothetical protein